MKIHRSILILTAAHFWIDAYASMLGSFLPFLHAKIDFSMAQAGLLGAALVISSSLLQPIYGYLADRTHSYMFTALAPGIAGLFIASLGLAPTYAVLLLFLLLGGVGIASFHPQGAAMTAQISRHRGYEMSFFIAGGFLGHSSGPIFIAVTIGWLGLTHSYWAALPGVAATLYLLSRGPRPAGSDQPRQKGRALLRALKQHSRPLLLHYAIVVMRSIIQIGFTTFLPLYMTTRGFTGMEASQVLGLFLFIGGIFGFVGGVLFDRVGGRFILVLSTVGCVPFLLGFLWTTGPVSIVLCALGGGFLLLPNSVNILMGQRLLRDGQNTVSALLMGFSWGSAGLFVPMIGRLSDSVGLESALAATVMVSLLGVLFCLALPGRVSEVGSGTDRPLVESA